MTKRGAEGIKKLGFKVSQLLERLEIPPRELSGGATWEACQQNSRENEKNLSPLRRDYRQKVESVLKDCWDVVEREFENRKPNTLNRLNRMRDKILDHTDPTYNHLCWLEPREGTFGPNKNLEREIENLAKELSIQARNLDADDLKDLQADAPQRLKDFFWVIRLVRSHPKIVVVGLLVLLALLIVKSCILGHKETPEQTRTTRYLTPDPNASRTPLHARTYAHIEQRAEYLIKEKINPWLMMKHTDTTITLHDGRTYGFHGLEYAGSVRDVFWGQLIEPFLKDYITDVLDEVGVECRENNIDASAPLQETGVLLKGMVYRIYIKMMTVDRTLRGEKPGRTAPDELLQWRIKQMEEIVDEQLGAAKALYSENARPSE